MEVFTSSGMLVTPLADEGKRHTHEPPRSLSMGSLRAEGNLSTRFSTRSPTRTHPIGEAHQPAAMCLSNDVRHAIHELALELLILAGVDGALGEQVGHVLVGVDPAHLDLALGD